MCIWFNFCPMCKEDLQEKDNEKHCPRCGYKTNGDLESLSASPDDLYVETKQRDTCHWNITGRCEAATCADCDLYTEERAFKITVACHIGYTAKRHPHRFPVESCYWCQKVGRCAAGPAGDGQYVLRSDMGESLKFCDGMCYDYINVDKAATGRLIINRKGRKD